MSEKITKVAQEVFEIVARRSNIPVDWILEIRAAKRGDRKLLIASILAGKPIDSADDAQELRETIARALARKPGKIGRPEDGLETKIIVPWGVKAGQYALISRSDGKKYRAARSLWQYQRDGMPYTDALVAAADKHKIRQETLDSWLRRTRERVSNDGDDS